MDDPNSLEETMKRAKEMFAEVQSIWPMIEMAWNRGYAYGYETCASEDVSYVE